MTPASLIEPLGSRAGPVRAARRLTRRSGRAAARRFIAEGPQAVREALGVKGCVVEVFATEDAAARHRALRAAAANAGVPWHPVDEATLARLADTVAPQGVVAVCGFVDVPLEHALGRSPRLVAVCVDVREPGNAGSVIRSADAAGADAVVLAGSSVDPYNGKAVRASAGSLFHLPVVIGPEPAVVTDALRAAGLLVLAATGAADLELDDLLDTSRASGHAWLFGNEAHGLSPSDVARADRAVRLPIYGRAESLNLATAAAVCLYSSARHLRRAVRDGSEGTTGSPSREGRGRLAP